MLSILGRHERAPDREFEVVFAPQGQFQTIDERAFVGNTPVFTAFVGQIVQWDVMAMGSEHHTFHVHGHRWIARGRRPARHPDGRARPRASRSAGRSRIPARGSTTATSRPT